MLFNSYLFCFLFLPLALAGAFALRYHNARQFLGFLTFASLLFYIGNNATDIIVLVGSLFFNYYVGRALEKNRSSAIFWFGIAGNIAVLGFFKYSAFIAAQVGAHYTLTLPLAISFYTFQHIVFLIDIYRRDIEKFDSSGYFCFSCFFPQLIAGPIAHYNEVVPQMQADSTRRFNTENFTIGLCLFFTGLFKKVVLADTLFAPTADKIFGAAAAGVEPSLADAWMGVLCYSFQLFFDFSGYSDMAIGLARMFNITLPINFNSPYKSGSIIDFWKNWHITLSRLLKDYIYIPLGGSRAGRARQYLNLLIVMFVAGLWHGTGLQFVVWGLLHGVALAVNHAWRLVPLGAVRMMTTYKVASVIGTFTLITGLWCFFRAADLDTAMVMVKGLAGLNGLVLPESYAGLSFLPASFNDHALLIANANEVAGNIVIGLFIVWALPNAYQVFGHYAPALYADIMHSFPRILQRALTFRFNIVWAMVFAAIGLAGLFSMGMVNREFLYFQF